MTKIKPTEGAPRDLSKIGRGFRHATFKREAIDADARTVEIAFSSETPYERWFGVEILDHAPTSVRLGRLANGGALLLDHDPRRHIGIVEQVSIDADRVGRAVVRFGKGADASEAFQDVVDGIRRHISVGYFVHKMTEDDEAETFTVTDWEPIEVSLVSIPADPTVGVGRASDDEIVTTEVIRRAAPDPQPPIADPAPVIIEAQPIPRKGIITMTTEPKVIEPADAERARVKDILAAGEQFAKYVTQREIADAIRNGKPFEAFKDLIMSNMETRHTDTSALQIGMTRNEAQRYSFARALQAAISGDWTKAGLERASSEAMAKILGASPEGFFVPYDIFRRDFNVGTATEAGNLVPTDLRGDLYVDALRNALIMSSLGVRILPGLSGNIDMPRKATPSTIGTLSEIGSATETTVLTAKVTLSPKRAGGFVEVSKQALIQAAMPLEAMLRDDLLKSAAVMIENLAISGVGSSNQPLGLRNTTGIGTVVAGTAGATVAWSHLVGLETACAAANAEPDTGAGYLINTKTRGAAKTVQKGTNLPFIWENTAQPLNGYRAAVTNNMPSNLTKGTNTTVCSAALFGSDWSMAVLGFFGAPDIVVDPYTKADTGQVKITLNQFFDFGVRQPAAFAKIEDLLT